MGMSNPKTTQLGRLVAYLTLTRRKQKFCTSLLKHSYRNMKVSPVCLNLKQSRRDVVSSYYFTRCLTPQCFAPRRFVDYDSTQSLQLNSCPQRKHRCVEIIWSKHERHYRVYLSCIIAFSIIRTGSMSPPRTALIVEGELPETIPTPFWLNVTGELPPLIFQNTN